MLGNSIKLSHYIIVAALIVVVLVVIVVVVGVVVVVVQTMVHFLAAKRSPTALCNVGCTASTVAIN